MIINGRELAEELIVDLKEQFKQFNNIVLAAIMVGDNPASLSFLKQKERVAKSLGIELRVHNLPSDISEEELIKEVEKLGNNKEISGIIIQLPLPGRFDLDKILKVLPTEKDVDGLSSNSLVLSPTVEIVKFILKRYKIRLVNKKIVLVGLGRLVGRPIYDWMKGDISVIDKNTYQEQKTSLIKAADILISGVGKGNLIPSKLIKQGAVVIDFGYSFNQGKICGDVEAAGKSYLFTPTPGGTGPLLVVMLYQNLLNLLKKG